MPITPKPKPQHNSSAPVDVDALIAKGGSIAQPDVLAKEEAKDTAAFTFRIPTDLLGTLDEHLKKRPIKTARQYWILEAIVEKLEKEGAEIER